jgi:ABC-type Fe3+/spermidine/putrescine transport system ATPase subunit
VYERPATTFVARFVGKMNDIPAVVAGANTVRVAGSPFTGLSLGSRPAGTDVHLLVRPEHLMLVAPGSGDVDVRVVAVAFHGPRSEITARLEPHGTVLTIDLPTDEARNWSADTVAGVSIDGTRVLVE